MKKRDFFSFCTGLKPIELRALGQLTTTVHLEEGDVLYHADDKADAIYIISRGVVEMIWNPENDTKAGDVGTTRKCYLSRGDMIGAVAVLTGGNYKNEVRVCESASVVCVPKEHLEQLSAEVPSFMRYVAEQLSAQLEQVNELSAVQSNCLELSGNLANFDLVTVFQTIHQSGQTGELVISDENDIPIGRFLFQEGSPRSGKFAHLTGEEALWQLFLRDIPGTFSFSRKASDDWSLEEAHCTRPAQDFLLSALKMRDEFQGILEKMPSADATLVPCNPSLSSAEAGLSHPVHCRIWETLRDSAVSLEALLASLPYNEFTLYQAVEQLMESGHLKACETPLSPIYNLTRRSPIHMRAIPNTTRVVRQSPVPI